MEEGVGWSGQRHGVLGSISSEESEKERADLGLGD